MHRRTRIARMGLPAVLALVLLAAAIAPAGAEGAHRHARRAERGSELFRRPTLAAEAVAAEVPAGFQEDVVISGLSAPTAAAFSPDGRVFVAEKSGIIKIFDSLGDTSPTVFADMQTNVYDYFDRGLLGLALDPNFPTDPYVYVLYTYDAPIGGTAPIWNDNCPNPPGATVDGCVASGRLSRLQASGNVMVGAEQVLIQDQWCQQYPSHSIGDLAFGPDGALYIGAGDGASFSFADYGQNGYPNKNPCGDPPSGVGGTQLPPTAEGGALRSQDLRTSGDPAGLSGALLRVDPDTGNALPDNPLYGSPDSYARRIIAYGFRNPFRFVVRPGTDEVWVGDVGWRSAEEIDRVADANDSVVENFGWPCYEGSAFQNSYRSLNLNICQNLYNESGAVTSPYFVYPHGSQFGPLDNCPTGSGMAITGMAFYEGGPYPASYDGALFFADYARSCIWVMSAGANGLPDPAQARTFAYPASGPVDLEIGPGGDLYYVDIVEGTIRRISYTGGPTAVIAADRTSGPLPLTVNFDGTGSSSPNPGALTYEWDLDGDGAYDDSTSPQPSYTYTAQGTFTVGLRVTDSTGSSDTDALAIEAGNSRPTAVIDTPTAGTTWRSGDVISFSGHATDPEETLPSSALSWSVILQHCSDGCHEHILQKFDGTTGGSFVAPDHEYPSYIELRLTATDSGGLTDTVSLELQPQTVQLTFASTPSGLQVVVGGASGATAFTVTAIVGSSNSISAPTPQTVGLTTYEFVSWSDGGAQSHNIVAGATPVTYTAAFGQPVAVSDFAFGPRTLNGASAGTTVLWKFNGPSDHTVTDRSGLNLFSSGTKPPGSTYSYTYIAAGSYSYACSIHSTMRGTIRIPMKASPTTGGTSTVFTLTWASAPPPPGFVFDVQIRRPGTTTYANWLTAQTATSATFVPDVGPGTYRFRARLRNTATGRASRYSTDRLITVS